MTFLDFCRIHGVVIDHLPPVGVWKRFKTEDKGGKRNGAVKFMGDHGFVQNWATMVSPVAWQADGRAVQAVPREQLQKAAQEAAQAKAQAADKAAWILRQAQTKEHAYLTAKGFPAEVGNVWQAGDAALLVIPMRVGNALVGCQLIDEAGGKKFLSGQRTGNAEFIFANSGPHILCEGYATALSARHALKNLKRRYTLHVTFSAGNMAKVADGLPGGYVLADNDASGTGERTAREIGWPYWMSDRVGEDANDYHLRVGLFALSQEMRTLLKSREVATEAPP
jgi:phage/plasmid primase-like uncharacterized protein